MVDMVMKAYTPELYGQLGIFIPLIVVNCLILARAEGFANKNKILPSIVDGFANGVGYTMTIVILAFIRELLGLGAIFGHELLSGEGIKPIGIIAQAPGSFIILGMILAVFNYVSSKKEESK